jgi:uncharacterized protein
MSVLSRRGCRRAFPFLSVPSFRRAMQIAIQNRLARIAAIATRRPRMLAAAATLVVASFASVMVLPEFILFRERLVLNLLEIESSVALEPFDITTEDGLSLRSWYHAPQPGKPVIVYFPGRAGDVVRKPKHLFELAEQGYGLTLAGYRGYGGNPGRPSERRLYGDATKLLLKLAERDYAPDGIVLYGYSMGTGIASHVAAASRARGLILEAPFTSFGDVVRNQSRAVPLWLVRTRFDTFSRMEGIHMPILLLAGEADEVTPPGFAERLASNNSAFASLHVIPGAVHDTIIESGAWETLSGFLDWLE